jgi:pimeloyl-ACP methyl ester carboxylesterase
MSKFNQLFLLISTLASGFPHEAFPKIRPEIPNLISATKNSEISYQTLSSFVNSVGQKKVGKLLKYGVRSYTVYYETKWKGKTVKASGLLLVPLGTNEPAPLISVQHGTSFSKDEAPTASPYTGMELFASAGYIVLMPDYLGYGSSSEIFHPYYDKAYSALAVIDMITASKEFLLREKIGFNDKLFLAGYSEGGYVTLAAAAEIENNVSYDLKVTAVAAGAGGYDLTHMLKGITTNAFYSYPAYLAFVLMSYNNTYDWGNPLTYYFKKTYADALTKYMGGGYSGWTINSHLTTDLPTLFEPNFYSDLKKADGQLTLKSALKKNTVGGWKTKTPIRLYHGTKDEIIPFKNSEGTLKSFHDTGSSHVTLTAIPGGTHGSSLLPMMEQFIPWFLELK